MTVTVTDHAVLRYLERVCGVDVDFLRQAIAKGCERGVDAGAPVIRFSGARFLVVHRTVVTALGDRSIVAYENMTSLMEQGVRERGDG